LDRVREFGYVAECHGSLGNWVLILRQIGQINHVIVSVIRHKLQHLGNGNPSHGCWRRPCEEAIRTLNDWKRLRSSDSA
jgi:DNA-binding transcriptional regulator PaaX